MRRVTLLGASSLSAATLLPALALLLVVALLLTACGAADRSTPDFAVRDTLVIHNGAELRVEIVENPAPGPTLPTWRIAEHPKLALGGIDAEGEYALFRIAGAFRLADGRVVVADGGSTQLKFFDSTGQFIGSAGRMGAGPGEFQYLTNLALRPGDHLVVWDPWQARLTTFDPAGELVGTTRIGTSSDGPPGDIVGAFDDGSLLVRAFGSFGDQPPSGLRREERHLFHLNADGSLADSLGVVPGDEIYYVPVDNGISIFQPLFARETKIVVAGAHYYQGDTGRPEVQMRRPDGALASLIRWDDPGRPITAADAERARQQHLETSFSDFQRINIERMFREVALPERMPAFSRLAVDSEGRLWVAEYRNQWDAGDVVWLIFDATGHLTARIELPDRFRPTQIGTDFILGITTDELDVEQVRLYQLDRLERG